MRSNLRSLSIKIFLILSLAASASAQTGNVKGKITDEKSNPLFSVNVVIVNTNLGTASDEKGNYVIKDVPAGEYIIRFSAVGYKTENEKIIITRRKTLELNQQLKSIPVELQDVNVTGNKGQQQSDTRTSLIDLNPKSAKVLPGAGEDVLRTLQALPGVLAPSDFSSQLIIRGSGPDQNLIIMDDVEIFNPYRLYGVISMFNPDAVADVNLITGGFPAKYGDRLSAVLDVTYREGNDQHYLSGSMNASIIDANLVLEGKNPFSLKGSWLFNSRRTYYDLIIEPFAKKAGLVDQSTTFPNFYDFQAKVVIGPYNGNKFIFNGINSHDGVDVVSGKDRRTADSVSLYNTTLNEVASIAWHYAPSSIFLNKVILSYYTNSGLTDFNSQVLDPSLDRNDFKHSLPDTLSNYLLGVSFNSDFGLRKYAFDDKMTYLWNDNEFEAGFGADAMRTQLTFLFNIDPQLRAVINSNPHFRAVFDNLKDLRYYNRYRAYIQNNFSIGDKIHFQTGLRYDYYNILHKGYIAPRVSLSYAIDKLTTLRANWGIYFESPGYEKLRDTGILYNLSDQYTRDLKAEEAIHYIVGIDRWLNNEWNLKVNLYLKDFSDLYTQKQVQGTEYYTEPVPGKDPHYLSGWTRPVSLQTDSLTLIPVNGSSGQAYGIEFFLAKKNIMNNNRLSGWISYSLAYANRDEYGREIPFRYDQRNTVNIVLNYEISTWLTLGMRWQYGSGFPRTSPVGVKPRIEVIDTNNDGIPDTPIIATRKESSNPNAPEKVIYDINYGNNLRNTRLPAYHRLDIRLSALANYWNLDWTFYLDIINVYNHSNVIGYDYFVNPDLTIGSKAQTMFPIIPTLGFSVKF